MKKLWLLFALTAVCGVGIVLYWFVPLNMPPRLIQPYRLPQARNDTFCVAFIGDSWAFEHHPHDSLLTHLLEEALQRPTKVHSYGICGHTSKDIYRALFINRPFRRFMTERHYDVCIVSAGINDTYRKMSTTYYRQSMDGIIQFLLANQVHPIIIEIPNYDIYRAYQIQHPSRKILRHVSMIVNKTPFDCRQLFRDTFQQLVNERGWTDSITIVRYKSWNNNFSSDQQQFYRHDGMHLNATGWHQLDSVFQICITRLQPD